METGFNNISRIWFCYWLRALVDLFVGWFFCITFISRILFLCAITSLLCLYLCINLLTRASVVQIRTRPHVFISPSFPHGKFSLQIKSHSEAQGTTFGNTIHFITTSGGRGHPDLPVLPQHCREAKGFATLLEQRKLLASIQPSLTTP